MMTTAKLSSKQELWCWLAFGAAGVVIFLHSHTFNVVAATYLYGLLLLFVVLFMFGFRFRKKQTPDPKWLIIIANLILFGTSGLFVIYLLGVLTWYA